MRPAIGVRMNDHAADDSGGVTGADPGVRAQRRMLRSPLLGGNTGGNPGLSRNCDQEAILQLATALGLEGGGER